MINSRQPFGGVIFGGSPFGGNGASQIAPIVAGAVLGRRRQKRQWYILPNGMKVQATEEGYRTLLQRAKYAQQETGQTPAIDLAKAKPTATDRPPEPIKEVIPIDPLAVHEPLLGAPAIPMPASLPDSGLLGPLIAKRALEEQAAARERALFEERRQQAEMVRKITAHAEQMRLAREYAEELPIIEEQILQTILDGEMR